MAAKANNEISAYSDRSSKKKKAKKAAAAAAKESMA